MEKRGVIHISIAAVLVASVIVLCKLCGQMQPPQNNSSVEESISVGEDIENAESEDFRFLGEGDGRPENFDKCPEPVTTDNIRHLYREYMVASVENTDLYLVKPHKIYTSSRYFNRLIRFENGMQVAAITYYGWNIDFIYCREIRYLLGLNSLATTAGYKNHSSFTCKTVLLDTSLNTISEREFRYKEQGDAYYAYTYIHSLDQKQYGYDFVVINSGFDSSDYFEYRGHLSNENVVTASSKRLVKTAE